MTIKIINGVYFARTLRKIKEADKYFFIGKIKGMEEHCAEGAFWRTIPQAELAALMS